MFVLFAHCCVEHRIAELGSVFFARTSVLTIERRDFDTRVARDTMLLKFSSLPCRYPSHEDSLWSRRCHASKAVLLRSSSHATWKSAGDTRKSR